jgi:nucleoside-diphosphate-sugar epimerase
MRGNALVTGATGFLGSQITKKLLAGGWSVTALTHGTRPDRLSGTAASQICWLDAAGSAERLDARPIDLVINASVCYERTGITASEIERVNCDEPLALMNYVARNNEECKFVFFDSFFSKFPASDTPQPAYTRAKQKLIDSLQQASSAFNGNVLVLRLEHVYGTGDNPKKVIPAIARALLQNQERIALTAAKGRRDLVFVDDVAEAVMCSIANATGRFTMLGCGSGTATPMHAVFETMKSITGSTSVLGFGDIENYDGIEESYAQIEQLCAWGWRPLTSLTSGLTQVVDGLRTEK